MTAMITMAAPMISTVSVGIFVPVSGATEGDGDGVVVVVGLSVGSGFIVDVGVVVGIMIESEVSMPMNVSAYELP